MTAENFISNFLNATDFLTPVDISLETEFRTLAEWDSLAALGVIVMFDMEYQKTITGDDLYRANTVGDLYGWIG